MFGSSNLFQMLSDDFMRDPFFEDPFRSAFSDAKFAEPFTGLTPFPVSGLLPVPTSSLPQYRGREVHIDSPRIPTVRPSTVSVEEVQDSEPAHLSTRTPQVQEPDDESPHRQWQPARQQASAHSMMDLFNGPFSHPAFAPMFGSEAFAASNSANTFCYTSTTYAQQAPDGTQFTQSSSSAYGPTGVTEHQKSFRDGRTGEHEMIISRQLRDKGRVVTKRRHADGSQSQEQQLRNVPDAEADTFDTEWKYEAQQSLPNYMRSHSAALPQANSGRPQSALGW